MEDLNSWLRRAHFSKRVHDLPEPDPLQIPIIPLTKLKLTPIKPNSSQARTSMVVTGDHTSKTSLESSSDIGLTGKVRLIFSSKMSKTGTASKRRLISEILKKVKDAVRRPFVAPTTREKTGVKTAKASLRLKHKNRWLKKYFSHGARQVGVLDGSSNSDWKPDMYELIRWKKMASRVRCPIHRANQECQDTD